MCTSWLEEYLHIHANQGFPSSHLCDPPVVSQKGNKSKVFIFSSQEVFPSRNACPGRVYDTSMRQALPRVTAWSYLKYRQWVSDRGSITQKHQLKMIYYIHVSRLCCSRQCRDSDLIFQITCKKYGSSWACTPHILSVQPAQSKITVSDARKIWNDCRVEKESRNVLMSTPWVTGEQLDPPESQAR